MHVRVVPVPARTTLLLFSQRFLVIAGLSLLTVTAFAQTEAAFRPLLQPQERDRIAREVIENPDLKPLMAQGPLRVISVTSYVPPKKGGPAAETKAVTIIVFSYGEGRAYRVLYQPSAKRVVSRELLPGRPQPSAEERKEVYSLIRADGAHAKLLAAGDVLEGGFAVDGPPGSSERDRFVQVLVLSADRQSFVRVVTVDLTTTKIVSSVPKE
jgi:hypothetical protein